jgi:hypothetical protein
MFLALYVDLFNLIFNSGKIPNTWLAGNIVPFYKNKGAKTDPKNFRPITILLLYRFKITLYILPFILHISNLYHKPSRHTVSKAFSKSINVQKSFLFFNLYLFIKTKGQKLILKTFDLLPF